MRTSSSIDAYNRSSEKTCYRLATNKRKENVKFQKYIYPTNTVDQAFHTTMNGERELK